MEAAALTFAHDGHWMTQLIYLTPFAALGGGLLMSWWKDRKRNSNCKETSK